MRRTAAGVVVLCLCSVILDAQTAPVPPSQPGSGAAVGGPALPPRDQQPPPTGDARIRGRVIAADTGRPLRRALVRLSGTPIRGSRAVSTDIDGRYEFTELPAGSYTLNASRSGYVPMGYRQLRPNTSIRPVVMTEHQRLDNADIALPQGGVITGRVLDEFGEPVTGAFVNAERMQYANGLRRPIGVGSTASSNDIGEFRLFGLPPGEYLVSAAIRNVGPPVERQMDRTGYAPTYYPSTPDAAAAQRVTVASGQTISGVDVSLVPTTVASISGTVLDATGTPLRQGGVTAMYRDRGFGGPPSPATSIRPDGSFVLNGVPPGKYVLRASVPPTNGLPPTPNSFSAAEVTVTGADVTNVVLQPQSLTPISGRLVGDPSLLARVRPGATRVMLAPTLPTFGPTPPPQPVADDLSFQLQAASGRATLRLMTAITDGFALDRVLLDGRDVTRGFDVDAGVPIGGLEVAIAPASARVTVTVTNPRNEPVIDRDVVIFPQDENDWGLAIPGHSASGRTGDTGQYQSPPLIAGQYYVVTVEPLENGQASDPELLATLRSTATRISVRDGDSATVGFRTTDR